MKQVSTVRAGATENNPQVRGLAAGCGGIWLAELPEPNRKLRHGAAAAIWRKALSNLVDADNEAGFIR